MPARPVSRPPSSGVGLRVFTYRVDGVIGHLVNPDLTLGDDEEVGPEGCLSLPGLRFDTPRAVQVVARGWNAFGEPVTVEGTHLLARAVQHETDHLDGILFVDRLDPEQRREAMRLVREADWGAATPVVRVSPHADASGGAECDSSWPAPRRPRCPRCWPCSPRGTRWSPWSPGPTPGPGAAARSRRRPSSRWRSSTASRCSRRPRRATRSSWRGCGELAPDCCPVVAYGALLPRVALDVPVHGWVNLHFSLLPAWRGAAPVQRALMAGDDVTGATTFVLEEGLDTGPVLGTLTETVRPDDTAGTLLDRLASRRGGAARGHDGRPGRRLAARGAAAGRRSEPGTQAEHRRGAGALVAAGPRRRPARARLHPGAGGLDEFRGERVKVGPVRFAAGPLR